MLPKQSLTSTLQIVAISTSLIVTNFSPAFGDGTVTSSEASFVWHDLATSATEGNADFRASNGLPDHAHQIWWWYRVESGAITGMQEIPFPPPDEENYSGSQSTLVWHSLGNPTAQFSATLTTSIFPHPLPGGVRLSQNLAITNTSPGPLALTVFSYVDMDVAGTPGNDNFELQGSGIDTTSSRLSDGSDHIEDFTFSFPPQMMVTRGHSENHPLLDSLNDSQVTVFTAWQTDSGDLAWAYRDEVQLATKTTTTIYFSRSINLAVFPFASCNAWFCPGDFNHDNRVDGRDIHQFTACIRAGQFAGECGCVDFDESGTISPGDVPTFAAKLLGINDPNPNCP